MADTRANLLTRKADLLAALRLIEQDYKDGVVDEEAYRTARHRYEQEAAAVLERLDTVTSDRDPTAAAAHRPPVQATGVPRWLFVAGAGALVLAAIVVFLVLAIQPRSGSQATTAQSSATPPPPSPRLLAAEREARAHPRSADALVNLGNAYLNNVQVAAADRAYMAAMQLDPTAPQPATLHAMILGSSGQSGQALALLRQVERRHPTYARAWVLDGLLSQRSNPAHAIAAWQQFLALEPKSSLSATVRDLIARTKKSSKTK
jgi:cytochrome c-type biogenesis protein CcmH/NrfG